MSPARLLLLGLSVFFAACSASGDPSFNDPIITPDEDTGEAVEEDTEAPAEEDTDVPATDTGTRKDSATSDSAKPDTTVPDTSVADTKVATDTSVADTTVVMTDASDPCALPPKDCTGTLAYCGELVAFEPVKGTGYDNYPINGETATNQYRSFCRRDLMMLVKYAAAYVECKGKTWTPGNGAPIGLGDMSEKDGSIPGTSIGSPGHPKGTHTNGYDMDIAYFQTAGTNNYLRPICPYTTGGVDQYHCTGAPTILDVKRTALFLGAFLTSDRVRVIGVDGQVGPLVIPEMQKLCDAGTLPKIACDRKGYLAYETTDTGKGWYLFHHHHLHVSLKALSADWIYPVAELSPGSPLFSRDVEPFKFVPGHAHVE
jgi:hypothetical protein